MSESLHIACPACGVKNRVPLSRYADRPCCGKCGTALLNDEPAVLTEATLHNYIKGNDALVVIDFWASWCQPCLMMAPQFSAAAKQMPHVRFAKIQTDTYEQAAAIHSIRSLPTLVAFKGGKEVARTSGALPTGQIVQWLQSL